MSALGHMLRYTLTIERAAAAGVDDWNQPGQTYSTLTTVRGAVQSKTAQERADASQAGPVASDYTIFCFPADVRAADRITYGGRTYEITAVREAGIVGLDHHLELDARVLP